MRKTDLIIIIFLVWIQFALITNFAVATPKCFPMPLNEKIKNSENIFIANLTSIQKLSEYSQDVNFEIKENLKGENEEKSFVFSDPKTEIGMYFDIDDIHKEFLFFGKIYENQFQRFGCDFLIRLPNDKIDEIRKILENTNQPSESLWPKTTLDTPSKVLIGEPFNVTFSYTFLEFKEDGTLDEISEDHGKSRISILIEIGDGVEILSAPGFELSEERMDRYNFTVHDYRKTVPYDDTKIMNETFTFQINEPMRFPYNRIGIWDDSTPQIRYLDYQDNVAIILVEEVHPDVGKDLTPIPFESATFPLDEEQQRNPEFIDSLAEFLFQNVFVSNMTEYLQNEGISEITIEELLSRYPELFESNNSIQTSVKSLVLAPKIQIKNGISINEIICKSELELIFKSSDNSPACVKPESVPKLIDRGWANG